MSALSEKVKWGILGTGNIARQYAAGLRSARHCVVSAVGSRTKEAAAEFAKTFHVENVHGSYEALIADPEVDAVYISMPNSLHCQWTLAALNAGKHVLCEKPLAMNAAEAQQMFAAAEKSGKLLMEAFMYRTHPQTLAVMDCVKRGGIGKLKMIRTSFCYRTTRIDGNVRFVRELGGGTLMDIGCYCISFSRLFAGAEPTAIHAVAKMHPTGVDEMVVGTLQFPDDILATFEAGMGLQADNTAYICGEEGYIEIPTPWKPPAHQAKFIITRGIQPRMDRPAGSPGSSSAPPLPLRDVRYVDAGVELYAVEADDFSQSIQEGRPARVTPADSIGNMRVLDAMREQIRLKFE
jgi:predicted dehydrogenase